MRMHGSGWSGFLSATDKSPKITWFLLLRVLRYTLTYRWPIASLLLVILASSALTLISPLIMRELIDRIIPAGDQRGLILAGAALLLAPLLGAALGVAHRRLNANIGESVIYDLRVGLYAHLQRMSLRFFTNSKVGELMSRLNSDVIGAQNAVSNTLVNIVTNLIQVLAISATLIVLEWRLLILGGLVMPVFFLVARLVGSRLREISRQQMNANAMMSAMMNETLGIGGALLVKLFGRIPVEVARFEDRADAVRRLGVERAFISSAFMAIIGLTSAVGIALVYGIGGYLVMQGDFTIGAIVAFGSYLSSLYGALQGLANSPVEFAQSVVSFERVFEVMDLPVEIAEKPDAIVLQDIRGELVFENVTFRYEVKEGSLLKEVERRGVSSVTAVFSGDLALSKAQDKTTKSADEPEAEDSEAMEEAPRSQARTVALENLTFTASPGQLVALVGPSGAGKTTATYLIPRLYDPNQGRILLDGRDLRDVTLESLTGQIGMVTQETHLFHDTIRTNLLYAKLDASQAELEAAARAANLHNFIAELPNGYDTIVGERGYRLSGGEKQRLALARVILKNPRLLVLDEATSHLDSESEALIQDALKRVMAGRTSIVIAHRLSTILAADQILVFDRGRIVERGTHRELLDLGGLYATLYQTQFSGN